MKIELIRYSGKRNYKNLFQKKSIYVSAFSNDWAPLLTQLVCSEKLRNQEDRKDITQRHRKPKDASIWGDEISEEKPKWWDPNLVPLFPSGYMLIHDGVLRSQMLKRKGSFRNYAAEEGVQQSPQLREHSLEKKVRQKEEDSGRQPSSFVIPASPLP